MAHLDVSGGPVAVQDVVGRVQGDGLRVKGDGPLEVPVLTGRVRLAHLLQEGGLCRVPAGFVFSRTCTARADLKIGESMINYQIENIFKLIDS